MKSTRIAENLELVETANGAYTVMEVPSETNPNKKYRVDIVNGRCSCPSWTFQAKNGKRPLCKHLKKLGFVQQPDSVQLIAKDWETEL